VSGLLVEAQDAHFAWMLGEVPGPPDLRLASGGIDEPWVYKWLRRNLARIAPPSSWLMVDSGEVVGMCSYKGPPDDSGAVEIGYGVAAERRRLGYATRAVAELIAVAGRDPRVRRLTAETAVSNAPSQRVLEANGFARTGTAHDADEGEMVVWGLALNPTLSSPAKRGGAGEVADREAG
jgi:RimJ/RimL family protein N-acetyltransferase